MLWLKCFPQIMNSSCVCIEGMSSNGVLKVRHRKDGLTGFAQEEVADSLRRSRHCCDEGSRKHSVQ